MKSLSAPRRSGPPWKTFLFCLLCFSQLGSARAEGTVSNCSPASLSAAVKGGGTVLFNCDGAIALSESIVITRDTVMDGAGRNVTLAAPTNGTRIFRVKSGVQFVLRNVTVSGGRANMGAGLFNDGGSVTLSDCTFQQNAATGRPGSDGANGTTDRPNGKDGTDGEPALGGAIYNRGEILASNCVFSANTALGGKGGNGGKGTNGGLFGGNGGRAGKGGMAAGGAIYNLGQLTARACTFQNNSATAGNGGTESQAGSGAFPGQGGNGGAGANARGGAIYSAGPSTLRGCLFVGNNITGGDSANAVLQKDGPGGGEGAGGGLYTVGKASLVNSTFTRNQAKGGKGGNGSSGGFAGAGGDGGNATGGGAASGGTLSVRNCTFSTNSVSGGTAGTGGSGPNTRVDGAPGKNLGGNLAQFAGGVSIENSILAYVGLGGNCAGQLDDRGHNISSDESCHFSAEGSRNRTDPRLDTLASNGGLTQTIALLKGSPAIDAANGDDCPANDQRGVARPQGAGCDIGAYERSGTFTISGTVTDNGVGLGGVRVIIEGQTATTDTNGVFVFHDVIPGDHTVAVLSSSFSVSPRSQSVTVGPSAAGINFFRTFSISGRVTENGKGISGIAVAANDQTTSSDATGSYRFSDLATGTYNVRVTGPGIGFNPTNRVVKIGPDVSGADFAANRARLTTLAGTNGPLTLSILGVPGQTYSIQVSGDLVTWTNLAPITAGSNGLALFLDSTGSNISRRFYRLLIP